MKSYAKFAEELLVVALVSIVSFVSKFLVMALVTKRLGIHEYGVWTQVQTTISLILGFSGLGFPIAILRFWPAEKDMRVIAGDLWGVSALVGSMALLCSGVVVVFAPTIAHAFFGNATYAVQFAGAISFVWCLDFVFLSAIRAFRNIKTYAFVTVLNSLVPVGAAAVVSSTGVGLLGILSVVLIVRACFLAYFLVHFGRRLGRGRVQLRRLYELFSFGAPTVIAVMSFWVVSLSDRYMIAYFLNASAVGAYSAAYQLGSVLLILATVLGFVLPPALSRLYDEKKTTELRVHLRYTVSIIVLFAVPFMVGSSMLAKPLLVLLSTAEIAKQAHYVVPLIALATGAYSLYIVTSQMLLLLGKTKILAGIWACAAILNAALNLVMIPRVGLLGAASTTLLAYSLALAFTALSVTRELSIGVDWRFAGKALIASSIMACVIWLVDSWMSLNVIFSVIIGMVVYGYIMIAQKAISKKERKFLESIFVRR